MLGGEVVMIGLEGGGSLLVSSISIPVVAAESESDPEPTPPTDNDGDDAGNESTGPLGALGIPPNDNDGGVVTDDISGVMVGEKLGMNVSSSCKSRDILDSPTCGLLRAIMAMRPIIL